MSGNTSFLLLALAAAAPLLASCDEVGELDDLSHPDASADTDVDADSDSDSDSDGDTDVIVDPDIDIDCPSAEIEDCGPTDGMDLLRAELLPDLGGAVTFVDAAFNPDPESPFDVAVLADVAPDDANQFQVLLLFRMDEAMESMDHPVTVAPLQDGDYTSVGQSVAAGNTDGSSWLFLATICVQEEDDDGHHECGLAGLRADGDPAEGFEVIDAYLPFPGIQGAAALGGAAWIYGNELSFTAWTWSDWTVPLPEDLGLDLRALDVEVEGVSPHAAVVGANGVVRRSFSPTTPGDWDEIVSGTGADLLAVDLWSGCLAAGGTEQAIVVEHDAAVFSCPAGAETITAVAWVDWEPPGLVRLKAGTDTGRILDVHTDDAQGATCVQTDFGRPILDLEVATVGEEKLLLVLTEEVLGWQMETWTEGD